MPVNDTYKSIASRSEGLYKDNGSRFISFAFPVESEDEAKAVVASVKKEYHDARHHCYAYRLGLEREVYRANDDGEPSGSAGRQILGQIDSAGLSDVLVVVVRYFGGIKLGIPGLVRAYKTSTADALASASVIEKVASRRFLLKFPYDKVPDLMKIVKDLGIRQLSQSFNLECEMKLNVRLCSLSDFFEKTEKLNIFIEEIK